MTAIIWILFLIAEGGEEAATFAHNNTRHPEGFKVHRYLVVDRVIVVIALAFSECWSLYPVYAEMIQYSWIELLALWLMLPFWHDGAYYQLRHWIEPHGPITKGYDWTSESETTTAWFSVSFAWRMLMFNAGLVLYIYQFSQSINIQ